MATQAKAVSSMEAKSPERQSFIRFSIAQRLEHILLIASFTALAITGLIQKFAGTPVAEWTIGALGGIEVVRTIHHIAAIIFVLEGIYHFIILGYKVFVKRVEMSMLPGLRDVTDGLDAVRYNLGLTKEHPRLPRYNFAEKMEYWAMIWGFALMAATGFVLWNPIFVTKLLPGQIIPAAKVAHGAEAILAVLAILIWHVYNVHIKMFNKSMFNGKMTRHQMEEEHAEELARFEAGETRPVPRPEDVRQRERVFLPVAVAGAVVVLLGLYWFTTFESTAIATIPPETAGPAFAPLTPTPVPPPTGEGNRAIGAPMPHPVEGKEQCDTCHGPNGVKPQPADHVGRPVSSCLVCHQPGPTATPGAAGGPAPAIPHALEGKEQCDLCHGGATSLMPLPADHAGRNNQTCTVCHQLAAGAATPAAGATSEAGPGGTAVSPKAIPHSIAEVAFQDCTLCHGAGKIKPAPANHATFTVDSCTGCHQPAQAGGTPEAGATAEATATSEAGTGGAASPKAIPHSITEATFQDCNACHGPGKIKPSPENHATFTMESCTICHKPAQQ